MKVTVRDVMVDHAGFCRPDSNLAEVAATMWTEGCGSLPVVNNAGQVTGMITDRDICIALGTRNVSASEVAVRDVSPARYFACGPNDEIHEAMTTMASQAVRRLPVVDEAGKLAGMLSIDDIVLHSRAGTGINPGSVVATLKAICGYRERSHGALTAVA